MLPLLQYLKQILLVPHHRDPSPQGLLFVRTESLHDDRDLVLRNALRLARKLRCGVELHYGCQGTQITIFPTDDLEGDLIPRWEHMPWTQELEK